MKKQKLYVLIINHAEYLEKQKKSSILPFQHPEITNANNILVYSLQVCFLCLVFI